RRLAARRPVDPGGDDRALWPQARDQAQAPHGARRGVAPLSQRRLLVSLSLSRRSAGAAQGKGRQAAQRQRQDKSQNARQGQGQGQEFLTKRPRLLINCVCAKHLQLTNFSLTRVDVLLAYLVNDYRSL